MVNTCTLGDKYGIKMTGTALQMKCQINCLIEKDRFCQWNEVYKDDPITNASDFIPCNTSERL